MKKRVLCLMIGGFEEIELVTPVDLLRRAGVDVVIASVHGGPATGRCGMALLPDVSLADAGGVAAYDALLIPGGPGVGELRRDGRAARMAGEFHAAGKPVAAICAAPLILQDAGLLEGRKFTSHSSVRGELSGSGEGRVVEDGLLITSRGAGTAFEFGLALVRRLAGDDAADAVADGVMA